MVRTVRGWRADGAADGRKVASWLDTRDAGAAPSPQPPPARGGGGFRSPRATAAISWAARSMSAAITAAVGCVHAKDGGLTGWAWHPGDPDVDPELTIRPARGRGRIRITASDTDVRIDNSGLLGRPRGFTVPPAALRGLSGLLHVRGRDGRDLLGSPLDPRAELEAGAAAADMLARLYPAGGARPPRPTAPSAIQVAPTLPPMTRAASRRQPPSMWWCRCMAVPSAHLPASTACWQACGGRAG